MGITLFEPEPSEKRFFVNFWHWRAIVEAIGRLGVLPDEKVSALHQPFIGSGLTADEARIVAAAIDTHLLPTLPPAERLLLDGQRTAEPDDCVFHREPELQHENYSTDREVLRQFSTFCAGCDGFSVA